MAHVPDLHSVADDTIRSLVAQERAELQPPITSAVWTWDESTSYQYQLNAKSQDFVSRYLGRSLITPDDPNMMQVNRELLALAFNVSRINLALFPLDQRLMWTFPFKTQPC